jgi:outer membrane protein TolC
MKERMPAVHCRRVAPVAVLLVALATTSSSIARSQTATHEEGLGIESPTPTDPMLALPPPAPVHIGSWDEALSLIRSQSPDYLSGAQAIEHAEAQKELAWSVVLPTVNGQLTYTHELLPPLRAAIGGVTIVTPPPDAWTVGGVLAWSIVNPRGIYGIGTANRGVDLARLSFEDARRQIAEIVVSTMLATLAAERVAELNRVGLRAALDRWALTQARLQFGQGTELDVDRAQQDVQAARSVLIGGDESLRRAREALGQSLGSPSAMSAPGNLDLGEFEMAVARTCRLNADIERRPDVAAARTRVEIADRAVHDAELQFSPSLAVGAQANYSDEPVLAPNTVIALEGVLNVPIFEGGARFAALRDAKAALEQSHQALASTRLQALFGAAQAAREVNVLQASREVASAERDLAARVDTRVRDGYSHGLGTSLDLVVSGQALRQADINLVLLEFQVAQARADAILTNAECVY